MTTPAVDGTDNIDFASPTTEEPVPHTDSATLSDRTAVIHTSLPYIDRYTDGYHHDEITQRINDELRTDIVEPDELVAQRYSTLQASYEKATNTFTSLTHSELLNN